MRHTAVTACGAGPARGHDRDRGRGRLASGPLVQGRQRRGQGGHLRLGADRDAQPVRKSRRAKVTYQDAGSAQTGSDLGRRVMGGSGKQKVGP